MKTCDKCGSNMKVKYSNGTRHYQCSNYKCHTAILINDEEILSITNMAEDMAESGFFVDSNLRRKEQTQLRKVATSLSKMAAENQYLSNSQRESLRNSADIIERLATATEKSKKVLKQQEEAEKLRVEKRYKQAKTMLNDNGYQLDPSYSIDEYLRHGVAMAIVTKQFWSVRDPYEHVRKEMRYIDNRGVGGGRTVKEYLSNEIYRLYRDGLDSAITGISRETEPVDLLVSKFINDVAKTREEEANRIDKMMEEIKSFLVKHQLIEANSKKGH